QANANLVGPAADTTPVDRAEIPAATGFFRTPRDGGCGRYRVGARQHWFAPPPSIVLRELSPTALQGPSGRFARTQALAVLRPGGGHYRRAVWQSRRDAAIRRWRWFLRPAAVAHRSARRRPEVCPRGYGWERFERWVEARRRWCSRRLHSRTVRHWCQSAC